MRLPALLSVLTALGACAPVPAPPDVPTAAAVVPTPGEGWIALYGNYVGKRIVITADGRPIEDRRFTFPPPGAVDRFAVTAGPSGRVLLAIEIEDCPEVWRRETAVAPGADTDLIFDGCAVTALAPAPR